MWCGRAIEAGLARPRAKLPSFAIARFDAATTSADTRTLAQLAMLGLAVLAVALWSAPSVPRWAPAMVILGCALFLAFWDVDNLMFAGALFLTAGFLPVAREL